MGPRTAKAKAQGKLGSTTLTLVLPPTHWTLALDLTGIIIMAFYFLFENSSPLAASSFLLSHPTVTVMPPALCCLLGKAREWASPAGPQAWPTFTWMLLLPPAYIPSAIALLFGQVDGVASVLLPRI